MMKFILRKKDSSTSILLFIFNNYMAKTAKDYMALSSLIEIMKVFGKNETTTRMSLSRATKAGLLTNIKQDNVVIYVLTTEGKKIIELWNEGAMNLAERYEFRNSKWNNKWHFLNIGFKKDINNSKAEFIDKLEQYGFAQINSNTWVTPYHQYEKVWKLIEDYDFSDGIIETYGEMTIHNDMSTFLDEVFGIKKLKPLYDQFINIYSDKLVEIKQIYKDSNFVSDGLALPILHQLGTHFFNIASDDAVLPKQILPEWQGDKAELIMKNLREMLLEATYEYFKKFD